MRARLPSRRDVYAAALMGAVVATILHDLLLSLPLPWR